jgi:hypothetical protein
MLAQKQVALVRFLDFQQTVIPRSFYLEFMYSLGLDSSLSGVWELEILLGEPIQAMQAPELLD